ncbi:hypothetical protein BaRGS_00014411, partial [Batillaria attramentaria]
EVFPTPMICAYRGGLRAHLTPAWPNSTPSYAAAAEAPASALSGATTASVNRAWAGSAFPGPG